MNKWLFIMVALFAIVGCKSTSEDVTLQVEENDTKPIERYDVVFNVLGLEYTQEDMSPVRRALNDGEEFTDPKTANITDIWIVDGDSLLQHQVSEDADFGNPTLSLVPGDHSITFICSSKSGQQFVDGMWSASSVSDTYGDVIELDVHQGMEPQQVVLHHANYVITWQSEDVVPLTAYTIKIGIYDHRNTLTGGLNGGHATSLYTFTIDAIPLRTFSYPLSVSGFCSSFNAVDSIVTTFEVLGKNDKRMYFFSQKIGVVNNRRTIIRGNLYGSTKSAIVLSEEWKPNEEVNI